MKNMVNHCKNLLNIEKVYTLGVHKLVIVSIMWYRNNIVTFAGYCVDIYFTFMVFVLSQNIKNIKNEY